MVKNFCSAFLGMMFLLLCSLFHKIERNNFGDNLVLLEKNRVLEQLSFLYSFYAVSSAMRWSFVIRIARYCAGMS